MALIITASFATNAWALGAAQPCLKKPADAGAGGKMDLLMNWTKKSTNETNMSTDYQQPQATQANMNSGGMANDMFKQHYPQQMPQLMALAQSIMSSFTSLLGKAGQSGSSITGGGGGGGGCQGPQPVSHFNWIPDA